MLVNGDEGEMLLGKTMEDVVEDADEEMLR